MSKWKNGSYKVIEETTYAELSSQKLKTGNYFTKFETYLQVNKDYQKVPVIEIKETFSIDDIKLVFYVIDASSIGRGNIYIISFSLTSCENTLAFDPTVKVQYYITSNKFY